MLPHADHDIAARDPALPGLATTLDVQAAAVLVARLLPDAPTSTPVMTYTRYKPGASCLTALRYSSTNGDTYVTLKAVGVEASEKWEKYAAHPRTVVDDALRIVVRRFPFDGALDGPRWLFNRDRHAEVCRTLALPDAQFDIIAYKPERRLVAVARSEGRAHSVVKCYDEAAYVHALRAHRALAAVPGLPVRTATAWHDRRCVIAAPWIEGRVMNVAFDPLHLFALAGEALAAIHNAPLDVREGEAESAAHAGLHRIAETVVQWVPDTHEPLSRLLSRLARHRDEQPGERTAIHGDFYTKQVLFGPAGVSLLDFDECAIADSHIDLAIFAAHLERDVLRGAYTRERATAVQVALLQGYRNSRAVDSRRLTWRTAEALLRLAPHPFRHRDPEWPALTRALVGRAESLLHSLPPHRPVVRPRTTPPAPVQYSAWRSLSADPSLSFVTPLCDDSVATRVLADRECAGERAAVLVHRSTMLRHKPGRRCLIAFDVSTDAGQESWLGKVRARGIDARTAMIQQALWRAGARYIPEPIGTVPAMRMTLQRAVPGVPLLRAFEQGASPATLGATLAHTLRAFHSVGVHTDRQWTIEHELTLLETRAASLQALLPSQAPSLARLYAGLTELAMPLRTRPATALLHRDFYHDQVIVQGSHCTLVDLDLVAHGDPALDIGNFVAHLLELQWRDQLDAGTASACITAFCDVSIRLSARTVTDDAIARYTLLALGRLIEIASRHADRAPFVPLLANRLAERVSRSAHQPTLTDLMEVRTWHAA